MATFEENVSTIRTAHYGSQMRSAIAEGLEQAYDNGGSGDGMYTLDLGTITLPFSGDSLSYKSPCGWSASDITVTGIESILYEHRGEIIKVKSFILDRSTPTGLLAYVFIDHNNSKYIIGLPPLNRFTLHYLGSVRNFSDFNVGGFWAFTRGEDSLRMVHSWGLPMEIGTVNVWYSNNAYYSSVSQTTISDWMVMEPQVPVCIRFENNNGGAFSGVCSRNGYAIIVGWAPSDSELNIGVLYISDTYNSTNDGYETSIVWEAAGKTEITSSASNMQIPTSKAVKDYVDARVQFGFDPSTGTLNITSTR